MSEQQHSISSSSLSAMQVFALHIEAETPHLLVLGVFESPRPFLLVRDTLHGIVVAFSSEADYLTYRQTVRQEGEHHA
jgi:hypothetical protein